MNTCILERTGAGNKPKKSLNLQGMLLKVQVAGVGSIMQELMGLRGEAALGLAAQLAQGCDKVAPHGVSCAVRVEYASQLVNDRVH